MHIHLFSLLLGIVYMALSEGGTCDYSTIPLEQQNYMDYVREMLKNGTQLFLKWGFNGPFRNNRTICWTSNKSQALNPGYQRHERFYNTVATSHWQDRETTYYVGPMNCTPTVMVQARNGGQPDPEVSGNFTLLFATPQCFVMGILGNASAQAINSPQPPTDNSSCQLWAQRHGNHTVKKLCEEAFYSNCSCVEGMYKRGHDHCNLTEGEGL